MGRESSAAINYELTNFATGKLNEESANEAYALANRLAPLVPVPGATGQYKAFDDVNAFQIYNTARAIGGDPVRLEFASSDPTYACKPHALEVTIDEWERKQAGDSPLAMKLLDQGKIAALTAAAAKSDAKDVVDTVLAAVTAVPDRGNWADAGVDPIDQIDEQLLGLSLAVGGKANINIDMDLSAWWAVRTNPKVKARAAANQVTPITQDQFRASLLFPVNFNATSIVYHSTKLGQATQTKARLLNAVCLIYVSVPNATVYDASAFKRFAVGIGAPRAEVRSWTKDNGLYDGHMLTWNKDIKQTSSAAIKRINVTVPA
jgi:hypothetical protein